MQLLFVYGTLRSDLSCPASSVLYRYGTSLGDATVNGRLYDIGGYPGLKLDRRNHNLGENSPVVYGELFQLRKAQWVFKQLDHYEECDQHFKRPHEYKRCRRLVRDYRGRARMAWVYLYQWDTTLKTRISSGHYAHYLSGKTNH